MKISEAKFRAPTSGPADANTPDPSRAPWQYYWWQNTLWLFSRRWFHRVWVIQEVALARKATVLLGDCSISWEVIGLAAAILRNNFNSNTPIVEQRNARVDLLYLRTGVLNAYFMYRLSRSQSYTKRIQVDFHDLLVLTQTFDCQDDRDRIYGLLGLHFSRHGHTSSKESFVMPDYSKTLSQVYNQVAERLILESRSLALLSSVQRPPPAWSRRSSKDHYKKSLEPPQPLIDWDMPSWVPQWNFNQTQSLASFQKNPKARSQQLNSPNIKIIPSQLEHSKKSLLVQVEAHSYRISLVSNLWTCSIFDIPDWYHEGKDLRGFPPVTAGIPPTGQGIIPHETLLRILTPENLTEVAMILTAGKDWHGAPIRTADEAAHMADLAAALIRGGLLWVLDEKEAFGRIYTDPRQDEWERLEWGENYNPGEEFSPEIGETGEQFWTRDGKRFCWHKVITDEQFERIRQVLERIVEQEAEKGYQPNGMRFLDAAGTIGRSRRRFTTEDGRRGIGPGAMLVGDVLGWVIDRSGDEDGNPFI